MKLPDAVRTPLTARWRAGHRRWLAGMDQDGWPMVVPLDLPTEAQALAQRSGLVTWIEVWRNWHGPGEVQWCERRWQMLGLQRLPHKLLIRSPDDLAAWVGEEERWRMAQARFAALTSRWPALGGILSRYYDLLADENESDFSRLLAMMSWLVEHPASGLYLRQVPVPGVDSKWLERRARALGSWIAHLSGLPDEQHAVLSLGLKSPPHLVRLFILDPGLRHKVGGLRDLAAPINDLTQLDLPVRWVLIVENLQSALALPDLPGTVALAALGKGVGLVLGLPWLVRADVHYWGDIDTHGFHILNLARRGLPGLRSFLMDEATLLAHQDLWGKEDHQYPADDLDALMPSEKRLFVALKENRWGQQVRLEQERIQWSWVERGLGAIGL